MKTLKHTFILTLQIAVFTLSIGDAKADSKSKTPAIDRIAKEGIRLTNAHTPSSVCTPTRYGLLTGRYPWRSYLQEGVLAYYAPAMIPRTEPQLHPI
jgi:arylsulfatase A